MHRIRGKFTYANVAASLALFLVLAGGSAFAASHLGKESVGAKQLKKEAVTPAKLSKAAKASMTGATGPAGPAGVAGRNGADGQPGAATGADSVPATLPSGQTEKGPLWGEQFNSTVVPAGSLAARILISFPVPLSVAPTPNYVKKGAPTAACPGSVEEPTAAPGQFCVYEFSAPASKFDDFINPAREELSTVSRFGGIVLLKNSVSANVVQAFGSWAVTAP
jgi:hypothetical protein